MDKECMLLPSRLAPEYKEGETSPDRAFHVVMLRSRFAETISKAKQLLDQGLKIHCATIQKEKERDNKKVDAEIKAITRKRRLQKEREAAREKLNKMQKTIDIYENLKTMRDFEKMIGC
ncbi:transcription factor GTE10-like [Henckelia pumila]|uniref:transcription factor GTE10-like n=1 Tax=Henckelia pumila TaxID=405737 RepID=UPI003C6DFBB0